MYRYEAGILARSKAGHDKGHVYIIMKERPRENIRERCIFDRASRQSPPTPE